MDVIRSAATPPDAAMTQAILQTLGVIGVIILALFLYGGVFLLSAFISPRKEEKLYIAAAPTKKEMEQAGAFVIGKWEE